MSAEVIGWQEEQSFDHRRRLRNGGLVSLAIHGLVFATLAFSPTKDAPPLPEVIAVEMVALPSGASRAPARPKAAPKPPAPAPAPEAPAPPPPPKAKVLVLPEETPGKIAKVKPKTDKKKPEPKTKPVAKTSPPKRRRGEPEKELSLEDAMAALDDELGPSETGDLLEARREAEAAQAAAAAASAKAREGARISAEYAAWSEAVLRRIQSQWVTPANLRNRGLATNLQFELSKSGEILGKIRIARSSGDPYFDDNAVRALLMVNPLPSPPRAGPTTFIFRSESD